ncbi:MAG: hypothetical protein IJ125_09025 [Atopobiaceae bacterium]|nr:hypothetical protein [Atopobiaceae bacterium]
MKKRPTVTLLTTMLTTAMLVFALFLAGCAGSSSNSDSNASTNSSNDIEKSGMSWPAMDTLTSLTAQDIRSVEYSRATEGGLSADKTNDATEVENLYLRLKEVTLKDPTQMGVDDDGLTIKLSTQDTTLSFAFEGNVLVLEDGSRYEVENLSSLKTYVDSLLEHSETPDTTDTDSQDTSTTTETSGAAATPSAGDSTGASNTTGATGSSAEAGSGNTSAYDGSSSADYDVSAGFEKQSWNGLEVLYFNDFMMTMPEGDKWSFEMDGNAVTFYLFSAQQEGYGGRLVTIRAFDMDDHSFENFPMEYHVAGVGQNVNKRFVAIYPSDVQWNHNDATQEADYKDLSDYLHKIGEGAVNSPLQTSDSN